MKWRAALIGCGRIGSEFADDPAAEPWGVITHAGAYTACRETQLVALCDSDPDRVDRCGRRWNVPARYLEPMRLLAKERPDIVSICTPDHTHFDLVREALLTDGVKAILAEKPLAMSVSQAEQLVLLARQRGVILAVNYSRRYADNHLRLREFLQKGGLGTIRLARGLYGKGTTHNGSHWFDLARFLMGDVVSVRAVNRLGEAGDDPTLDVHLQLTSGIVAVLLASPAEEFTIFEMELFGSRGRIRLLDSGNIVEYYRILENRPFAGYRCLALAERTVGGMRDTLLHAVEDLVHCLKSGSSPCCSGEDGVAALRIAAAAHESAGSDRPVNLENR